MNRPVPRIQLVRHGSPSARRVPLVACIVIAVVWLLSLVAVWLLASRLAAPQLGQAQAELRASQRKAADLQQQIQAMKQRQVNLTVSDQISRAANNEVQASLAERDEQIAALRADVAFYERLVGATSQRKGLNAHSIEFAPEAGGTWAYTVVLTQNLNRGAISEGQLRFAVEGVRNGKLTTVSWNELHQKPDAPGQAYSFRYFQQLSGSVILPKDFTPQRVRISLSGGGAPVNQTFDWKSAGDPGAGE
ncbi:MAG TPA: DUF6776 family protein [Stenotrophomonas sp.]|nr:DUF6776 family protein [Stenotrophomonas sp.]